MTSAVAVASTTSVERPAAVGRCVVSDRYRFMVLLIAKNASTSLRKDFRRNPFAGHEAHYRDIDQAVRDEYFTVAPIREPVSRLLSAYQEVSLRFEMGQLADKGRTFFEMDDGPERFQTFLSELGNANWDSHVRPQARYLRDVRVDLYICVERLQDGISEMCRRLRVESCPQIQNARSRQDRRESYGYGKFYLVPSDLDEKSRAHIRDLYADDVRLYETLFPSA